MPIYVKLYAYSQNNVLDTLYNQNATVSISYGNASNFIIGSSITFTNGIAEYNDLYFTSPGNYQLKFEANGLLETYTDTFTIINGLALSNSVADKLIIPGYQDSIEINANLYVYVLAMNLAGNSIDTTYNDSVYIQQLSGSGSINGNTQIKFNNGICIFSSIGFSKADIYSLQIVSNLLLSDSFQITVFDSTINICNSPTVGERTNIGLFGGMAQDLAYSYKTNRIFACIESPVSLLYSDDTTHQWKTSFSSDSLSFECEERGWGGGGIRVLTNTKGWVLAQTNEQGGNLSSAVISYSNGDSASWQTALDIYLLLNAGYTNPNTIKAIELNDYKLYVASETTITVLDSGSTDIANNTINITDKIPGLPANTSINWLSVANNSTGYPIYVSIDTSYTNINELGKNALLYKYDGINFSQINLPVNFNGIKNHYVHRGSSNGDTVFVSWYNKTTDSLQIIRSFDGGANWIDITPINTNGFDFKQTYSKTWSTNHPLSDGSLLHLGGSAYSFDLGTNWTYFSEKDLGNFILKPDNELLSIGAKQLRVEMSLNGISGTYSPNKNIDFEAIKVFDIERSKFKSDFYVATNLGLAYSNAYLNDTLENYEKWQMPFGKFPLTDTNGDTIYATSIAMSPTDSNHIITGLDGFYVTTTGYTGFSKVFNLNADTTVKGYISDIAFIDSGIVLAVTMDKDMLTPVGNIWRSQDGGFNWSKIAVSGFSQGRVIAVGNADNKTVVYIGSGNDLVQDGKLWRSDDLGLSWSQINTGLTYNTIDKTSTTEQPIIDIAIDSRSNDTLFLLSDLAIAKSIDGGNTYNYLNYMGSNGTYTAIDIDNEDPDSVYLAVGNEIVFYDAIKDSSLLLLRAYPGETTYDLEIGSILIGTTTGFYSVGLDPFDDISVNVENIVTPNLMNVSIYPNPANGELTILLETKEASDFKIELYNIVGKKIKEIYSTIKETEKKQLILQTSLLAEGTYLLSIKSNTEILSKKIVITH